MPPKYKSGRRKFPPKSSSTSAPTSSSSAASASSASSASSSTPNVLDSEVADQMETELCWCIQQLYMVLHTGHLNERQILETNKTLKVLQSNTAPLIKKRQFMRTSFGDYRAKMANDEKILGKYSKQVKFSDSNSKTNLNSNTKFIFIKKAATSSHSTNDIKSAENTEPTNFRIVPTGNAFRFDFSEPEKS